MKIYFNYSSFRNTLILFFHSIVFVCSIDVLKVSEDYLNDPLCLRKYFNKCFSLRSINMITDKSEKCVVCQRQINEHLPCDLLFWSDQTKEYASNICIFNHFFYWPKTSVKITKNFSFLNKKKYVFFAIPQIVLHESAFSFFYGLKYFCHPLASIDYFIEKICDPFIWREENISVLLNNIGDCKDQNSSSSCFKVSFIERLANIQTNFIKYEKAVKFFTLENYKKKLTFFEELKNDFDDYLFDSNFCDFISKGYNDSILPKFIFILLSISKDLKNAKISNIAVRCTKHLIDFYPDHASNMFFITAKYFIYAGIPFDISLLGLSAKKLNISDDQKILLAHEILQSSAPIDAGLAGYLNEFHFEDYEECFVKLVNHVANIHQMLGTGIRNNSIFNLFYYFGRKEISHFSFDLIYDVLIFYEADLYYTILLIPALYSRNLVYLKLTRELCQILFKCEQNSIENLLAIFIIEYNTNIDFRIEIFDDFILKSSGLNRTKLSALINNIANEEEYLLKYFSSFL